MKIFPNSKIYITCPANFASGGPELLHQLAAHLRSRGVQAYMYYMPDNAAQPVHPNYERYHIPFVRMCENLPENVIVMPEVAQNIFQSDAKIRFIIWWLSVDNWIDFVLYEYGKAKENPLLNPIDVIFQFPGDTRWIHWVQSEYARQFIALNGIDSSRIHYVGDYLGEDFLKPGTQEERNDIVLYNPKKGIEFTRKIIENSPDIKWVPIEGLSPFSAAKLMRGAKLYADFGHHPGRDRIPREAAVSGCCVITGRRGSAANDTDVPIPDEFKFQDSDENIGKIIEKIRFILENFESETKKFEPYRKIILSEPEKFAREVDAAFSLSPGGDSQKIALMKVSDFSITLWKMLSGIEGAQPVYFVDDRYAGKCAESGGKLLPVISSEEAATLYAGGYISAFAADSRDKAADALDKMNIPSEGRMIV